MLTMFLARSGCMATKGNFHTQELRVQSSFRALSFGRTVDTSLHSPKIYQNSQFQYAHSKGPFIPVIF